MFRFTITFNSYTNMPNIPFLILSSVLVIFGLSACDKSEATPDCDSDAQILMTTNTCLVIEDDGELADHYVSINNIAEAIVEDVNNVMPVPNLTIRVRANASDAIPEIGIGGYNPNADEVILSVNPNFPDLATSIDTWFGPTLAHEMHHARRRRSVGYGNTLLQALVTEGLADCFAVEITGIVPPGLPHSQKNNWMNGSRPPVPHGMIHRTTTATGFLAHR